MDAIKKLEEFILKLHINQNEPGRSDKLNELKLNLDCSDRKISQGNLDNINFHESSSIVDNK
jgi:hypothetical protein